MNRVLIVDDEESVLNQIQDIVEKLGFVPITATSAEMGLKLFQRDRPGIVLADLHLGAGMDGVALCSRIKYEDSSVIFIAISGYFSEYDKIFCLSAGFTDFLVKPVDTNDLNSALQCAFERRQRWNKIP